MVIPNNLILMSHLTAKLILGKTNLFYLFNFYISWDVAR